MKDFFKTIGFGVIVSFFVFLYYSNKLNSLDRFALGEIYYFRNSGKKFVCSYRFYDDSGNRFEGHYRSVVKRKNFNDTIHYLVGYDRSDPSTNYIFLRHPVLENRQLDSINRSSSPQELITIWDNFKGF